MTRCFGDTFFFLALLNRDDDAHERATKFSETFDGRIVTSRYVLVEFADALSGRTSRRRCAAYLRFLEAEDDVEIVEGDRDLFDRGLRLYDQRADKAWSLTDCTSFVIMQRKRLSEALTGDHHFEQAGFVALLK
jgi:predicted nucleic acid-binding protein